MFTITRCKISHCNRAANATGYCEVCTPSAVAIRYTTCEGCERCTTDAYVPHYNCIYSGNAMGHSAAHCTADSCY